MTAYDYGFRIYNPAIARFLSRDPLSADYPFYSPYAFAGNIPTVFIDLDGLEPVKAELFWKPRPDLEVKLHGKNQDWVTYYQTQGIHSNDQYFSNSHKMIVAHTYSNSGSDNYAYWDDGMKGWVPFNVSDIGINAKQATMATVGGLAFATGGILLAESAPLVFQYVKSNGDDFARGFVVDAINQAAANAITNGMDGEQAFMDIDWANAVIKGLTETAPFKAKSKLGKNAVKFLAETAKTTIDFKGSKGFNFKGDFSDPDVLAEFLTRQLFAHVPTSKTDKQLNMVQDLFKKITRKYYAEFASDQIKSVKKE